MNGYVSVGDLVLKHYNRNQWSLSGNLRVEEVMIRESECLY